VATPFGAARDVTKNPADRFSKKPISGVIATVTTIKLRAPPSFF
jgi:hypothetical protein